MNPTPSLLRLAWPLMISFTARSLLTSIDIPYASRLGDAAVAAIGLAFPLEFCFIACWVGVSAALTSHLSRAMGEGHEDRLHQLKRSAVHIIIALVAGFLTLAAATYALAPLLIPDPHVARAFQLYAPILIAGCALSGFWSIVPDSVVKAHHDTTSTMVAGLLTGFLNLALNTLFLFVFHWGLPGIALATGLGRTGGLLYALLRAHRLETTRRTQWADSPPPPSPHDPSLTPQGLYPSPHRTLLLLGIPSSLTFALMGTESLALNAILARLDHATAALAAYAIYHRATLLLTMPVVATGVAVLPFVARYLGQGRQDVVRQGLREGFAFSFAYVLLGIAPLAYLFGDSVASFLGSSDTTQSLAAVAVQVAAPLGALSAIPFLLGRPAFEALQRGSPGLILAGIRFALSISLAAAFTHVAPQLGLHPFTGLVAGVITASALVSLTMSAWLLRALRHTP